MRHTRGRPAVAGCCGTADGWASDVGIGSVGGCDGTLPGPNGPAGGVGTASDFGRAARSVDASGAAGAAVAASAAVAGATADDVVGGGGVSTCMGTAGTASATPALAPAPAGG